MLAEHNLPDPCKISELCIFIRCSDKTARKLIKENAFPNAYRVGNRWRIPKADAVAFRNRKGAKQ